MIINYLTNLALTTLVIADKSREYLKSS